MDEVMIYNSLSTIAVLISKYTATVQIKILMETDGREELTEKILVIRTFRYRVILMVTGVTGVRVVIVVSRKLFYTYEF